MCGVDQLNLPSKADIAESTTQEVESSAFFGAFEEQRGELRATEAGARGSNAREWAPADAGSVFRLHGLMSDADAMTWSCAYSAEAVVSMNSMRRFPFGTAQV
ncbi:hypothetical protein ACVWWQ_001167 [Rhodanobacter sp. TND4EL1]